MSENSWSDIVPSFIRIPISIFKKRHLIQKIFVTALLKLNKGQTNIAVLGRPNVGKSIMLSLINEDIGKMSWSKPKISQKVESKAIIFGNWTKIVRVIPGQTSQERFKGIDSSIDKSKALEGIIYVCDWGYTNIRDQVIKNKLIADGITKIDDLRKINLKEELKDFRTLSSQIKKSYSVEKKPKWLLILVNKADLFYLDHELNKAQDYYSLNGSGDFSAELKDLSDYLGYQNFKIASLPLCSYQEDFVWNKNEKKSQISKDEHRKALVKNLFTTISNFK